MVTSATSPCWECADSVEDVDFDEDRECEAVARRRAVAWIPMLQDSATISCFVQHVR